METYLAQLIEITPTSAGWREYAGIMREQATLERMRDGAGKLAQARGLDEARPIVADLAQNFQTATGHECADHAGIVQPVLRPSRTTERAALCVDGLSGPGRGDIPPKRRYFDYRRGAGRRNQGTRNSPTAYKPRWTN